MDPDDNPFEILGVSDDASDAEIKKAFRKGALKYHPDKQQTEDDKEEAHHIFAKLAAAYDTVSDPVKRNDWRQRREARGRHAYSTSPPPSDDRRRNTQGISSPSGNKAGSYRDGHRPAKKPESPSGRSSSGHPSANKKMESPRSSKLSHSPGNKYHDSPSSRSAKSTYPSNKPPPDSPSVHSTKSAYSTRSTYSTKTVPTMADSFSGNSKSFDSPAGRSTKSAFSGKTNSQPPIRRTSSLGRDDVRRPSSQRGQRPVSKTPPPPVNRGDPKPRSIISTNGSSRPQSERPRNDGQAKPQSSRSGGGGGPSRPQSTRSAAPRSSDGVTKPLGTRSNSYTPPPPQGSARSSVKRIPNAGRNPSPRTVRDPFDVFDSVMKEEFGDNYRESERSGWKQSKGVPGLAKMGIYKKKSENSRKEFKKLDVNKDKSLSKDELAAYVASHSELWSVLSQSLNLSVPRCMEIATDVAFSLATGEGIRKPMNNEFRKKQNRELTEAEFTHFHKNYVLKPEGATEFYLRTLFSAFDLNGDGVLERKELDRFLNVFYKAKDVFKGDMRLPTKQELERIIFSRLDKNKDGFLSFPEMRSLLEVVAVVTIDKP